MFHSGTQRFLAVWSALAEGGLPLRASFRPEALGDLLPRVLLLERSDEPLVRLAGEAVERLFGCDLNRKPWLDFWTPDSRPLAGSAAFQIGREARPAVIVAEAGADAAPFEVSLVPLRGSVGAADRVLGLYQPLTAAGAALTDAAPLSARLSAMVGEPRRPSLRVAAVDGRRVA